MTRWRLLLMTCAVALAASAWAGDVQPPKAQAPKAPPADTRKAPDAADRGAVVVPPVTDPAAVAPPPKNVDPKIHAKPPDRKNHRKKTRKERKEQP